MSKSAFGTILLTLSLFLAALCHAGEKSRLVTNLEAGKKQVVVTYGTSLTSHGAWVKQVSNKLNRKYPGLVTVHNSGGLAKWSDWGVKNLDVKVLKKNPDTVFIEFAINDCVDRFKATVEIAQNNLTHMIDRILEVNPDCEIILMAMNPVTGKWARYRSRLPKFYQMYRDVAEKRGFLLIDHYPKWKKILDEEPRLFKKYVPDGLHPGPEGCKEVITPEIIRSLGMKAEQKDSGDKK